MHCGSKIIVQEAIRSVRIDNTHMLSNWIEMGDRAAESDNLEEAYNFYTKVLEIQPDNWQIIFKRGMIAGRQSTINNSRLLEAATAFATAIELAPVNQKEGIIEDAFLELITLAQGLVALRIAQFRLFPDQEEAINTLNEVNEIKRITGEFTERTRVRLPGLFERIAGLIYSEVVSTFNNKILPEYGGERKHPSDYDFTLFLSRITLCNLLINIAIGINDKDDESNLQRYETMIILEEHALSSCSYEYDITQYGEIWKKSRALNDEGRRIRQNNISLYKNKILNIKNKKRMEEDARQKEKERVAAEEAKKREEAYWNQNLEEKQTYLENENKRKEIKETIGQLQNERGKLGLFSGKEKKIIDSRLTELQNKLSLIENEIRNIKNKFR